MRVKLIQAPQNPVDVMWTAARTCYASESPVEMWDNWQKLLDPNNEEVQCTFEEYNSKKEKMWKLVKTVLDSGHLSIAEQICFTFAIEGISRACSHQLVRHRHCTFSQQSQRYVEIKENKDQLQALLIHPVSEKEQLIEIANKYFVDVNEGNYTAYLKCLRSYLTQTANGVKAEDARNILPNATRTNIVMTVNFRELMHICNLRLCTRAQKEIRELFGLIKKEVEKVDPRLAAMLVPSCEVQGFCQEHKCCGRKPSIKDLKVIYKEYKSETISKEDLEAIFAEGKVNIKLKELMEMKSVLED